MEKLKKYKDGTLSPEESERITSQLIRQHFDEQQRTKWARTLQNKHGVSRSPAATTRRLSIHWKSISGIAAGLLILCLAGWFLIRSQTPEYQRLADNYTEMLPIMADQWAFRKGTTETELTRLQANEAFAAEDYSGAIRLWESLSTQAALTPFDQFYLGASYLLQDVSTPGQAIELLQDETAFPAGIKQERDWVLTLAYVQDDQLEQARALLEQIITNDQYMAAEAVKLLQAIQDLE